MTTNRSIKSTLENDRSPFDTLVLRSNSLDRMRSLLPADLYIIFSIGAKISMTLQEYKKPGKIH